MTGAKFEYLSLIGQGSNQQSLMLVTSHVRLALCTLAKSKSVPENNVVLIHQKEFIFLVFFCL